MMDFECRLSGLEEYLCTPEVCEEFEDDYCEHVMPTSSEAIYLFGPDIEVSGLGIVISEGVFCEMDDDGEFVPDWALTIIREPDKHWSEYMYLEQDPIMVSLHNLFRALDREYDLDSICVLKHKEDTW